MKKRFLWITLWVYIFLSITLAIASIWYCYSALGEGNTMYVVVSEKSCLNVRVTPSGSICFKLFRGDEVKIDHTDSEWAYIDFCGDFGWVKLEYLSDMLPWDEEGKIGYITANGRVALRKKASSSASLVRWLHNGEKIKLYCISDGWYKCEGGYVKEEFIDIK